MHRGRKHRGLATDRQSDASLRVMPELRRTPPLPYVPPCFPGELLSSWLHRVAAEYGVGLAHLASHIGLPVSRASLIDHRLSRDDLCLAASALRLGPGELQAMVHVPKALGLGPSAFVLQLCPNCQADHKPATRSRVAIRAWFEFWQIECAVAAGRSRRLAPRGLIGSIPPARSRCGSRACEKRLGSVRGSSQISPGGRSPRAGRR